MLEYHAIKDYYGDRVAERSKVKLIEHINKGLIILDLIGASSAAKAAFCLHPLFQTDEALAVEGGEFAKISTNPYPIMLAMEYRARANACLSDQVATGFNPYTQEKYFFMKVEADPGNLIEVKHMLIADKLQNQKDFELYHRDHKRAKELAFYFDHWRKVLSD